MVFSDDFAVISRRDLWRLGGGRRPGAPCAFPADLRYVRARAPTTIWGAAYMQGGLLGLASYHSSAPGDCYISYEAAPPDWRLDDGTRPPAVKRFASPSWDAADAHVRRRDRLERGAVRRRRRWATIVFSEDFGTVTGGEVARVRCRRRATDTHRFGRNCTELYVEEIAQLFHLLVPEAG